MTKEEQCKVAIKEGLQEWLDEKMVSFGILSMKSIAALFLVALVYIWASSQGWKI
jgi:hypothetical protein